MLKLKYSKINFNFLIDPFLGKKDSKNQTSFYVVVKCQKIFDKLKMLLQFMSFKTWKRIKTYLFFMCTKWEYQQEENTIFEVVLRLELHLTKIKNG